MQIHLLGYSEGTLSRIFDVLEALGHQKELVIVENMKVDETVPFHTRKLTFRKILWQDWSFDRNEQRCFPAMMNPAAKRSAFQFFYDNCGVRKEDYCNLFHPSAVIASTVTFQNAVMVEPGSVIASYAELGFSVYINRCCSVGHHCILEDFVMLGPGVHVAGHCRIGTGAKLGIGSVVFDHVSIGENTIIGGGSVVTGDLPPNVIAWGNPCKVIRKIEEHA